MREPAAARAWPSAREIAGELAALAVIALILAALGPFGSFALGGFAARLAYWLPAAFLGYAIFRPISLLVMTAAERMGIGELPALLIAVAIAAFPASAAMLWLGGFRLGRALRLDGLLQLYVQVALIGGLIGGFFVVLSRPRAAQPLAQGPAAATDQVEVTAAPPPAFLARLPPAWRDQLVALEMEDHYVRAHGPDGRSLLILMRMADAERELANADGARVHRSWWVMRPALRGVRRKGRALEIDLANGLSAPVARDRLAALRREGWPL